MVGILGTAAPFLLAWLVVAPLLGAYAPTVRHGKGEAVRAVLPCWATAVPTGILLRSLYKGYLMSTPFWVVTLVFTGVLLSAWRCIHDEAASRGLLGEGARATKEWGF